MAAKVYCTVLVQQKGLQCFSTGTSGDRLKLVLLNTTPMTRALATSTANCCGISTHVDVTAISDSSDWKGPAKGRMLWIKKTTDINARKASTRVIKAVGLLGYSPSTMLFVTKCSTRSYSTSGPDKVNASSWAIIFYDPTTAT